MWKRIALVPLVVLAVACEPADTGGGAGVGGKLAFLRTGALIVSQDSGDGEKPLTNDNTSAAPALSPNGQTIAFAFSDTGDENARALVTVPVGGGQRTVLATPPAGTTYGEPAWSKDGTTLYFTATTGADTHLFQIPVDGGTPAAIAETQTDLHFPTALDANTLVVSKGNDLALNKLNLQTGELTALGVSSPSRAAVSPDGKFLAYAKAGASTAIVVRDLASGAETALATTGFGDVNPAFAPDGTFVAFDAKGPSEASPKIYAAKTDGTGGTLLLQSGSNVSWSP